MTPTLGERFWSKVLITETCWLWIAGRTDSGYGFYSIKNRTLRAHRLSYEALRGPIPEGLVLDHLCRVRHCINPDHLEPVTSAENCARGRPGNLNGETCRNGLHPWPDEAEVRDGGLACRPCRRANWARRYEKVPCPECGQIKSRYLLAKHRATHQASEIAS